MKAGNKVKVIKEDNWQGDSLGKIGTIIDIDKASIEYRGYDVKFDDGEHWWYEAYELELIEEE